MKRQPRVITAVVTVGLLIGLMPGPAGAWPGDLDGSFGACGVSPVDVLPGTASVARAAALQSDGKVVVAGSSDDRGLVMRLDGGALDPTFGVAGRNRVRVSGVGRYFAIAPTSGGGAVVAGDRTNGAVVDTIVARVRQNGTLDPTFHANGRLTVDVGGNDSARAVASLSDGRVLAAGNANTGGYVARFGNDGTPDTSWDGDGRVTGLALMVRAIATRADGSVYVAGSTSTSSSDWRIIHLSSDGSVDTSFGGSNGMTVDVGGQDVITAIVVQPDGKVVAAGYGNGASGHGQTIVRRYLEGGTPDSSFTNYREAFGINDAPSALTRQSDGHLVVAVNSKVGSDNDIVLARLGDDGTPDDGFGVGGVSVVDAGRRSAVNAVVAPPDGRIMAIGSVRQAGRDVVGLFRFQPDSSTVACRPRAWSWTASGPFTVGVPGVKRLLPASSGMPTGPDGTSCAASRHSPDPRDSRWTRTAASTGSRSVTDPCRRSWAGRIGTVRTSSAASRRCRKEPVDSCSISRAVCTHSRSTVARCPSRLRTLRTGRDSTLPGALR